MCYYIIIKYIALFQALPFAFNLLALGVKRWAVVHFVETCGFVVFKHDDFALTLVGVPSAADNVHIVYCAVFGHCHLFDAVGAALTFDCVGLGGSVAVGAYCAVDKGCGYVTL